MPSTPKPAALVGEWVTFLPTIVAPSWPHHHHRRPPNRQPAGHRMRTEDALTSTFALQVPTRCPARPRASALPPPPLPAPVSPPIRPPLPQADPRPGTAKLRARFRRARRPGKPTFPMAHHSRVYVLHGGCSLEPIALQSTSYSVKVRLQWPPAADNPRVPTDHSPLYLLPPKPGKACERRFLCPPRPSIFMAAECLPLRPRHLHSRAHSVPVRSKSQSCVACSRKSYPGQPCPPY